MSADPLNRPGITRETLIASGIRHVTSEDGKALIGYAASGLAIPYTTPAGHPLEVSGRPFYRIRVDEPRGAKYLSPKDSGAQLYIPKSHRAQTTLIVTEGEFKALSLCEAGFFAVGLGGITSALHDGKLLPALAGLIEKKAVSTVAFLGDSDTALIYDFANETAKLRKALPPSVRLILPRVPFTGPKGIDDAREEMGEGFNTFMQGILAEAVEVPEKPSPGSLALRLLLPVLPDVLADYDANEMRLMRFAKRLDPVSLDKLAKAVKAGAEISLGAFKKAVTNFGGQAEHEAKETPQLFFDGDKYFRRAFDEVSFESICRPDAFLEFRALGFSERQPEDGGLSPLERAIHKVQTENRVHYAGALCGRPAGLHEEGGIKILATSGPKLIEPGEGDPSPMIQFLTGLFGEGTDPHFQTQTVVFFGWLRHARQSLRRPAQYLPGQALALVGDTNCGKSLLQSLITVMMGGRSQDASLHLLGKSEFNAEIWKAEHIFLDDDTLGEDGRQAHAVRDRLKKLVVARQYNLHGKGRDAVGFRPIWRTTISANLDGESINVLPPPDETFGGKITYLKCYPPAMPFHDGTDEGSAAFWNRLVESIPPFLSGIDSFEPPAEMLDSRFFVKEFHHPEVLAAIFASAQEGPLGELLDEWMESTGEAIEDTSSRIYCELAAWATESRVRQYVKSVRHLGHELGRLSRHPIWRDRIKKGEIRVGGRIKNDSVNVWTIQPKTALRTNAD